MDGYQELANAIVLQAVKDYRMTENQQDLDSLERFFRSEWFAVLTTLDPDFLIQQLQKEKATKDKMKMRRRLK